MARFRDCQHCGVPSPLLPVRALLKRWSVSTNLPGTGHDGAIGGVSVLMTTACLCLQGTLFLWMFWPSFNSVLVDGVVKKRNAIHNTYYAIAVSAVIAFALSALTNKNGKLQMVREKRRLLCLETCLCVKLFMLKVKRQIS